MPPRAAQRLKSSIYMRGTLSRPAICHRSIWRGRTNDEQQGSIAGASPSSKFHGLVEKPAKKVLGRVLVAATTTSTPPCAFKKKGTTKPNKTPRFSGASGRQNRLRDRRIDSKFSEIEAANLLTRSLVKQRRSAILGRRRITITDFVGPRRVRSLEQGFSLQLNRGRSFQLANPVAAKPLAQWAACESIGSSGKAFGHRRSIGPGSLRLPRILNKAFLDLARISAFSPKGPIEFQFQAPVTLLK